MKVSTIEEIKQAMAGEVISLPPFVPGTSFTARLRRVSIASMVRAGKIPNPLLQKVYGLFQDKSFAKRLSSGQTEENANELKDLMAFIDAVVTEALLEPSLQELQKEGIFLTDEQKNAIFEYIQQGAAALGSFRNQQGSDAGDTAGKGVSSAPKPIYSAGR